MKREIAGEEAERFLSQKVSNRVSKVLLECPDIGRTIEDFVIAGNVGADKWRITGVLTFDGNTKLPSKYPLYAFT